MRQQISKYIDHALTLLLLVVAGATPLFFFNQTTEFYEVPKLLFLIVSTVLLLGLWIFSWILKGKVVITRTPLDIPLIVLLGVVLASTYFSASRDVAIYGNFPRVHGSAVSWVVYILLYFVTVSHLKDLARVKSLLYVLYGSAGVVALVSLLSFFGVYLPFDFAQAVNFTPTGSSFSTIAFLTVLLPLPLLSILNKNKYLSAPLSVVLATLFGLTIVLTGSFTSYVGLMVAFVVCLFISKSAQIKKALGLFMVPVVAVALALFLTYWPTPLPAGLNNIQKMEASFPKEIQLPFAISWKVSASVFRDATFLGTGPSSYLFNFNTYKPTEFNLLKFWNFSFDTAHDEFLQVLGTLGLLGFLSLLVTSLVVLKNSWKNIALGKEDAHGDSSTHVLLPALAVSGILSVLLLALHATTLVSIVVTFFVFAALMASQKSVREKVMELSIGIKASTVGKQVDLFPVLVFIVFLLAAVPVLYQTFNVALADYYHHQALVQASKNGTLTYQYLQNAERLSPRIDLYRVDMAQTNFALANAIAAKKGPTKDNPKGSLTDKDKQTIQTLLSQSINEGRVAVALNSRSSRNWEVIASIYRNITGVANNALAFSLDSYGKAIQRDPLNPVLRLNVGGIYYSVKNYDLAIRFFSDAINLKPDYVNAYFNLAIALRDKGDLQNATAVAQQMVALLQKDTNSPDYKLSVKLLEDLKKKASDQQASAGKTGSALENSELGKVSDLKNPPTPATPAAVKKNPKVNLPTTPTPAPKKK